MSRVHEAFAAADARHTRCFAPPHMNPNRKRTPTVTAWMLTACVSIGALFRATSFGVEPAAIAGSLGLVAEATTLAHSRIRDRRPPNVILLSIDSLRADHVGCYGERRATTPAIDALAGEGIRFARASSVTSWTLPAHASLFTGIYPTALGVVLPRDRLPDRAITLAETLTEAGYRTAAIVSGPFLQRRFGLAQGFDSFDDSLVGSRASRDAHADVTNPQMEERLLDWLDRHGRDDRPFFLFAYFWDPHYDYLPPPPYDEMFVPVGAEPFDLRGYEQNSEISPEISRARLDYIVSQYDGEVRATDDVLGRVFRRVRELGKWDETLVIVTADHGEEFFEHGNKGHKNNLFAETVEVPLVVKLPGTSGSPSVDDRIASLVDVPATIYDAVGLAERSTPPTMGRSLLRTADGTPRFLELVTTTYLEDSAGEATGFTQSLWLGVREQRFSLVGNESERHYQLFDTVSDVGQRTPVAGQHPEVWPELYATLVGWHATMVRTAGSAARGERADVDPETRAQLEALGYL